VCNEAAYSLVAEQLLCRGELLRRAVWTRLRSPRSGALCFGLVVLPGLCSRDDTVFHRSVQYCSDSVFESKVA
jgi:hypothetical protein